mmetsp:Transcript_11280/g.30308  ORF Transcript_11280/g.30308 Transcript_11280/m.30308 type:complete len:377 (+) Transcript_11280:417-1547(+)
MRDSYESFACKDLSKEHSDGSAVSLSMPSGRRCIEDCRTAANLMSKASLMPPGLGPLSSALSVEPLSCLLAAGGPISSPELFKEGVRRGFRNDPKVTTTSLKYSEPAGNSWPSRAFQTTPWALGLPGLPKSSGNLAATNAGFTLTPWWENIGSGTVRFPEAPAPLLQASDEAGATTSVSSSLPSASDSLPAAEHLRTHPATASHAASRASSCISASLCRSRRQPTNPAKLAGSCGGGGGSGGFEAGAASGSDATAWPPADGGASTTAASAAGADAAASSASSASCGTSCAAAAADAETGRAAEGPSVGASAGGEGGPSAAKVSPVVPPSTAGDASCAAATTAASSLEDMGEKIWHVETAREVTGRGLHGAECVLST